MGADFSFHMKTIETHVRTFWALNISAIGRVIKADEPTPKDSSLEESSTGHCSDPTEFSEDSSWSGDCDLCNPKCYKLCQNHEVELSSSNNEVPTATAVGSGWILCKKCYELIPKAKTTTNETQTSMPWPCRLSIQHRSILNFDVP